jgi:hypothetical protein
MNREFYLRCLLQCGACGEAMRPCVVRAKPRYACASCAAMVDAEATESIVWEQASRSRPHLLERDTPVDKRREALERYLRHASVTPAALTVRLTWRRPIHQRRSI